MDTKVADDTPCSSIAVESTLRVGTAGALWGLCRGPYDATNSGLTGFSRASFVAKLMGKTGAQCGMFAGMFSLTCCGIQNYRGKKDVINSAAAGAIAGVVIAAGTRSKKQVAAMAALLSVVNSFAMEIMICGRKALCYIES